MPYSPPLARTLPCPPPHSRTHTRPGWFYVCVHRGKEGGIPFKKEYLFSNHPTPPPTPHLPAAAAPTPFPFSEDHKNKQAKQTKALLPTHTQCKPPPTDAPTIRRNTPRLHEHCPYPPPPLFRRRTLVQRVSPHTKASSNLPPPFHPPFHPPPRSRSPTCESVRASAGGAMVYCRYSGATQTHKGAARAALLLVSFSLSLVHTHNLPIQVHPNHLLRLLFVCTRRHSRLQTPTPLVQRAAPRESVVSVCALGGGTPHPTTLPHPAPTMAFVCLPRQSGRSHTKTKRTLNDDGVLTPIPHNKQHKPTPPPKKKQTNKKTNKNPCDSVTKKKQKRSRLRAGHSCEQTRLCGGVPSLSMVCSSTLSPIPTPLHLSQSSESYKQTTNQTNKTKRKRPRHMPTCTAAPGFRFLTHKNQTNQRKKKRKEKKKRKKTHARQPIHVLPVPFLLFIFHRKPRRLTLRTASFWIPPPPLPMSLCQKEWLD